MSKKRDLELFIVDIFIAIYRIENYTHSFRSAQELWQDSLHWDAVIRELEIIGEAIKNLLQDEHFFQLSPQYFRQIVNFRNIVAHAYFGIDEEEVWSVIQHKLHPLHNDLKLLSQTHFDLDEAFGTIIDYDLKNRDLALKNYLKKLHKEYKNHAR